MCVGLVAEGDGQAGPQRTTLTKHDATLTEREGGRLPHACLQEKFLYHCPRKLYILYSPRIFLGIGPASYT